MLSNGKLVVAEVITSDEMPMTTNFMLSDATLIMVSPYGSSRIAPNGSYWAYQQLT